MMPLFLVSRRYGSRMGQRLCALSRVLGLLAVLVAGHGVDRLDGGKPSFFSGQWPLDSLAWDCSWHGDTFCFLQPMFAVCFFPAGWVAIGLIGSAAIQNVSVSLIVSLLCLGGGAVPARISFREQGPFPGVRSVGEPVLLSAVLTVPERLRNR
jgi:NNP family nitrate/nitrite transporter-like MFS transporter